jgi:LysM repeat protein
MRSCAKPSSFGASLRLILLLTVEAGAGGGLVHLASLPFLRTPGLSLVAWGRWLPTTPPPDALAAVARLGATGGAAWLLATTLLYCLGRLSALPRLLRSIAGTTPLPLRRIVDGALALSVVATVAGVAVGGAALAGPAPSPPPVVATVASPASPPGTVIAGPGAPPGVLVFPGMAPAAATSPGTPPSPGLTVPLPSPGPAVVATTATPAEDPGSGSPAPSVASSPSDLHVVVAGDNLWSIAEETLGASTGEPLNQLGDARIAAYWTAVVRVNRPHLRSGNPSLIYPGESVSLPPVT